MTTQSARWLKPVIIMITLWIQPFSIQPLLAQPFALEWKFTPPGPGPDFDPTTLTFTLPASQTDIEWYSAKADKVTLSSVKKQGGNRIVTLDSPSFLNPIWVSPTPDNVMPKNAFWDYPNPVLTVAVEPDLTIQPVLAGYEQLSSNIPEPATWEMMLLGFLGLAFGFRQSRRRVSLAGSA